MNSRLTELLKNLYKENILDDINNTEKVLKNISDLTPKIVDNLLSALRLGRLKEIRIIKRTAKQCHASLPHCLTNEYPNEIETIMILAFVCDAISEEEMYKMFKENGIIYETCVPKILINNLKEVENGMRKCPICAEAVLPEAKMCRYCKSSIETTKCHFCAEKILKIAKKCKYCESNLVGQSTPLIVTSIFEKTAPFLLFGRYEILKINNDEMVKDHKTGLIWQRLYETNMNWETALKYSQNLCYGGYSDWRIPTLNELKTLINENQDSTSDFPAIMNGTYFWSSSERYGYSNSRRVIEFRTGRTECVLEKNKENIMCVR